MDIQQWTKIGIKIAEPLKEIKRIAKQSGISQLNVAIFPEGNSWATYIDEEKRASFETNISEDGTLELRENGKSYYTQS